MIAFACSHCGMKLKVQDQFAGRPSKCPTCKQPLVVPMPSVTAAYVPPQQIDGAESSLARAGLGGGVTLDNDPAGRRPTTAQKPQRSVSEALAKRKQSNQRYVIEGEIARGGMGAVLRAVDCDIRREVAVKYMLDDKDPKKKARFIEEAQINGQLEHPNIVPVYDLGIDAQKRPFIMMKMVKGRSLKEVLDQLRGEGEGEGEPGRVSARSAEQEYTLGRLLNILVNVCNALAFAHARGVVHRDLKPANIMLGDFGEVYVMDWGLAKVLGSGEPGASATGVSAPARASKVVISREPEADLTQEGSVLGTPVYMPPEQATGNLNTIDQRSDVYSLGAILYEMLTLQPPVTKEGGYLGVLMQVVQGEIISPQQREPKRARAGQIPKDLAAIAMKALAKEKDNRYPTADALRQDIERFQEGRSVSAKADTVRELAWKLVKRNKGASLATAAALIVLAVVLSFSFKYNYEARLEAVANLTKFEQEQAEKRKLAQDSVPSLVLAAKLLRDQGRFDEAMKQVNVALSFEPNEAEAHLVRGQLLIGDQRYADALEELETCLKLRPDQAVAAAGNLAKLCRGARADDTGNLSALADELARQKAFALSDQVTNQARKLGLSRQELVARYQKRIEAAWPGLGNRVKITDVGIDLNLDRGQVRDLTPLKGMELTSLNLDHCGEVRDLTPLQGMKLTRLNLTHCTQIKGLALAPLKDMPLRSLSLPPSTTDKDLTLLQGMKLSSLSLHSCGQVRDLTPLKGIPLTSLGLSYCTQVQTLTPLEGMQLTSLGLAGCDQVLDLAPLKGMPLTSLNLAGCSKVRDLTQLQGMELQEIVLTPKNITKGMDILLQMKSLKTIGIDWVRTAQWPVAEFWKKYDAGEFK